jgi:hypothetical protein
MDEVDDGCNTFDDGCNTFDDGFTKFDDGFNVFEDGFMFVLMDDEASVIVEELGWMLFVMMSARY